MVRTVLANRKLERYVISTTENLKFFYGIIVGQTSSTNKEYVIHLARTLELLDGTEAENKDNENETQETIDNFDDKNLINHSISVTKMIPGSFYVLGIFMVTENNLFENSEYVNKFKGIFKNLYGALNLNKYLCGNPPNQENSEKLLLNYSWSDRSFKCKSFDSNGDNPTLVDWKFLDKPTVWQMFESNYELDDVYPIKEGTECFNIEKNFLTTLKHVNEFIECSQIFIQNQYVDENQLLESYIKDKVNKKETIESLKASIFQLASVTPKSSPTISEYCGTIRYMGTIYSRIWVHPKSSFKDIQQFIRNDIIRSLAARTQIFCDGLSNPNISNDSIIVNIPPKRVFFDIPECGGIQFSEYLFSGEGFNTVIQQVKDILDLSITENNIYLEVETLPDYDDTISIYAKSSLLSSNTQTENINEMTNENRKYLYYGGLGMALIILFISILLNFIWR